MSVPSVTDTVSTWRPSMRASPAEADGAAVRACGVTKVFAVGGLLPGRPRHRVEALSGVDLEVDRGRIHGLIGENGSGKSTLLRVLATLVLPTAGSASVGGVDVVRDPVGVRRMLGFSTGEERSLYWRLTGRQNLAFYADLHGVRAPQPRITEVLDRLGLRDSGDRPVSGYSQGMARRLALGRALLHEPPVLILDEPTRSLDPLGRETIHRLLTDLRRQGRTTVLIATHDLEEAADLCDEVSVLHRGVMTGPFPSRDAARLREELRVASG